MQLLPAPSIEEEPIAEPIDELSDPQRRPFIFTCLYDGDADIVRKVTKMLGMTYTGGGGAFVIDGNYGDFLLEYYRIRGK